MKTWRTGPGSCWLQLAALAVTLTAWLRHLALDGELALAEPKTLRFRLFAVPARIAELVTELRDELGRRTEGLQAWVGVGSRKFIP